MPKVIKKKVVVYVVREGKLLVMRHRDFSYEEVGIQVPAGTVEDFEMETTREMNGESVIGDTAGYAHAALRELQEETGIMDFEIVKYLGAANYDISPHRNEIQERHFYLAHATKNLPERWYSQEDHDGEGEPTRFECFWVPLAQGHILQASQSAYVWKLVE